MSAIDPITLAVIQAALGQVCNEMDIAFSRAAFSPVIAEADDRSSGIYDRTTGALISQGELGLPVFVGTMQYSTRRADPPDRRRQGRRARARRHLHRQRSLPRRHAPDGRALRPALLLPGRALLLAAEHRALAGHRRHGARRLLGACHGGRAGGPAAAAGEALQARGDGRRDLLDPELQHAHRRPAHRRHQGPGRRAQDRRAAPDRADGPLWPGRGGRGDRRDPAARGEAHARAHRRDSRRCLCFRGLRRFRRRRQRAAEDRALRHQGRRVAELRLHGLVAALPRSR